MNVGDQFMQKFVVNDDIYHGFISLFNDKNPLHTDGVFAKNKGFQGQVMHGNILNGFLSFFVGECLPAKDVIIHSQSINYKKPVYLNDVLLLTASVTHFSEAVNALEFSFYFTNDKGIKVATGNLQIGLLK